MWSSTKDGTVLRRMNNVSSTTIDNSLMYTDSYNIPQLSTADDGKVIQCEAVININPPVILAHNLKLKAIGEY